MSAFSRQFTFISFARQEASPVKWGSKKPPGSIKTTFILENFDWTETSVAREEINLLLTHKIFDKTSNAFVKSKTGK